MTTPPQSGGGIDGRVSFIENRGQWPSSVCFLARTARMLVRVEDGAVVLDLPDSSADPSLHVLIRLDLGRTGSRTRPQGEALLPGVYHFLMGKDPSRWTKFVQRFSRVRYSCIEDGIDLVLREELGNLEYDLELDAGADLSAVVISCSGIERLDLDADGSLIMLTALGALRQPCPRSEEVLSDGTRHGVAVRFRIIDGTHFGFDAPGRNAELPLRIDPGLIWSTYLGSSGSIGGSETVAASASDRAGNVTLVGWANGYDFPTTPGAMVAQPPGGAVAFVTKLDTTGNLVYSSTIGAQGGGARALAVALDGLGRATVGGILFNGTLFVSNFPTTPGAFDTIMSSGNTSGFALRLTEMGDSLVYSTFIEGAGNGSRVDALDVAASGATVVGGFTGSSAFPTTPGAFDTTYSQNQDGFVTRLDPTGSFLEWSTFLGGSNTDDVTALKLDSSDQVTAVGLTGSQDFPITPGTFDQTIALAGGSFITRINAQGNALVWSAFLGGNPQPGAGNALASGLALEPSGGVVVIGSCTDFTFPTTPGALFSTHLLGATDSFVVRVSPDGSVLRYSTLLSRAALAHGVAVDASGVVTVTGADVNGTMPLTAGAYNSTHANVADGFLARINPTGTKLYYSTVFGSPGVDESMTLTMIGAHRVAFGGHAENGIPVTPGSFDQTFNGGNDDCFAAVMDLFLQGSRGIGRSTPSCLGDLTMNVTRMPSAGASDFGFYCSGAPPLAQGWLVLGYESQTPGLVQGASILLDTTQRIWRIQVRSNGDGFVETPFPLTGIPSGVHFAAQYVFVNTANCPGIGTLSASHAVSVDVQ